MTTNRGAAARRAWVELYRRTGDAGLVCRRCGVSRPTLRKWWRRYRAGGDAALIERSRRPHTSPRRKLTPELEGWILQLRTRRKLGHKRIQAELLRLHHVRLSTATIWKVLVRHDRRRLQRRPQPTAPKRYARALPGERVQLDTVKIAAGLYQYTATDDCTRVRVLGVYPRRSGNMSVAFLERLVEEFPFPIQRIQTDRGGEFFAECFQRALQSYCIKFRPIRPRSPHLNGKVERSQQTDRLEFWAIVDAKNTDLAAELALWQFFYNWHRPHSGLAGQTPMERCLELLPSTPLGETVSDSFDPRRERLRVRNYREDQQLDKLKRSL